MDVGLPNMDTPNYTPLTPEEIKRIAHEQAEPPMFGSHDATTQRSDAQYSKAMRENGPYLTLGIQMAVTMAMFSALGWWLSNETGNSYWLGICAGFGAVMGLGYFILVVTRMEKSKKR